MTTTRLYTIDELPAIEEPGRYDLIRGELVTSGLADASHSDVSVTIGARLTRHVRESRSGRVYAPDTGFVLERDPDTVLRPDVSFVSADRLPPSGEREGFLPLAPDLAAEVVAPDDLAWVVNTVVQEYLRAGTRLVLVVQPELRSIAVWTPDRRARVYGEAEEIDFDDVLPGFRLRVADVFA